MQPSGLNKQTACARVRCAVRSGRGFTLIEMMISIVILAVLLGIAVPSLTGLIRDQRVKAATYDVYASFALARSEAIKRNSNVVITPNTADWGGGWQIQAGGASLKNQDAINKVSISGPAGTVTYQRDGRISGASAPNFVVKSADDSTITARCIRVDLSGRPNIKVDTNHNASDGCQ